MASLDRGTLNLQETIACADAGIVAWTSLVRRGARWTVSGCPGSTPVHPGHAVFGQAEAFCGELKFCWKLTNAAMHAATVKITSSAFTIGLRSSFARPSTRPSRGSATLPHLVL